MPIDIEIKFISKANTQIKFYNRNLQVEAFRKIEKLLVALDIQIENKTSSLRENSTIRDDTYFDDGWRLADNGYSLSIRSYKGQRTDKAFPDVLIYKYDETKGHSDGVPSITRKELRVNLEDGMKDKFLKDGISVCDLEKYFPDADFALDSGTKLVRQGGAHIKRSSYAVRTEFQRYRISVDRYYFISRNYDKYSEVFHEIEIENRAEDSNFHPKIKQAADILQAMFEVEAAPKSKYHRFKDFVVSDDFQEYYFVGFDIVSYSIEQSWKQKQVVQLFHKIIKDQVSRAGFSRNNDLTKISIGDGAVVAARANWDNVVGFIETIKIAVDNANKKDPNRKIEYRTAIHYGPVFSFTDLNDMINVAGNGINVLNRILGEVKEGEIFLSRDAYKRIIDGAPIDAKKFAEIGERTVKHGAVVHLYRYLNGLDGKDGG